MVKPDLKIVVSNPPPAAPLIVSPEQVEMPFAVVNGEAITHMPRDLYIPPQALEIFLEAFEGPLDLLLYLIRRQNVDILNIPIAEITLQYTQYIELMQDLQLELAGEYLLMAATLAEIKSRMLLPRPAGDGDNAELDPRAELVRRLQEYERFKRAAAMYGKRAPSCATSRRCAPCRRSVCRKCCWHLRRSRYARPCSRIIM
jgi:segregation and condensation protein A